MKIFWSWQSDVSPKSCRSLIKSALTDAIKQVSLELDVEDADRPEIDHDTKDVPGMVDIPATILQKISEAACFVADMTPIARTAGGKAVANPNVCIELGWAMQKPGLANIIAVMNLAGGWTIDDRPFDIKQRRTIVFTLPEDAKPEEAAKVRKQLIKDFAGALKTNLSAQLEARAADNPIKGVEANPDDASIWATAKPTLTYFDDRGQHSVLLEEGPRGYLRIIPAAWKNGPPSVVDIKELPDHEKIWPPSTGGSSGDLGTCEEGFLNLWFTGKDGAEFTTGNVACYFDETGEFWLLHGTAIHTTSNGRFLAINSLMIGWQSALRAATSIFDKFGALPTRRVEFGISGLSGCRWPGNGSFDQPIARKPRFRWECQRRVWTEAAQLEVITDAYNGVRDIFSLAKADLAATKAVLA
ncbi:MAG: hypothetical protein R3D51_17245 [Hyphomicrobiaceae bacterium]